MGEPQHFGGSCAALIRAMLDQFKKCIITGLAFIFCGIHFFLVPEMITDVFPLSAWLEHPSLGVVSSEKQNGDILNGASHTVSLFSLHCHLLWVQKSLVDQSAPEKTRWM
ncbi:hypothetical protein GRJ2_001927700 [Grus japonensis]|uniref:Uncharacterized protein n=1 Tax=Grus japonensis TaxID=30415 RepID=A0ABC9XAG7_GRUJA